ncbi:MAG: hypothetical protein K9M81_05965 [Chthoniobacterales bacterium]|nr:hypothetical protein [Chthoniobacterales bacterium]
MDATLSSKSSSDSMYSYSCRQTSSLALPHQPSQPPRCDPYEICGLDGCYVGLTFYFGSSNAQSPASKYSNAFTH